MLKFDAKLLTKPEKRPGSGYSWFECNPEIIYPQVIARILEVLKSGEFPNELVDNNSDFDVDPRSVARLYLSDARKIPAEAWKYALQPRDKFQDQEKIIMRAEALHLARLWFTQALHVQIGGNGTPMGVHWTDAPAFKL